MADFFFPGCGLKLPKPHLNNYDYDLTPEKKEPFRIRYLTVPAILKQKEGSIRIINITCASPLVVNCTATENLHVNLCECNRTIIQMANEFPLPRSFDHHTNAIIVHNKYLYCIIAAYYHYVPAIILDGMLRILGKKPSSFKTGSFWEERRELESPNLGALFPHHITPAITFPQGSRKWVVVGKDNWTPCGAYFLSDLRNSPPFKRRQLLRSTFVSLRGNFKTARDRLVRYERVNTTNKSSG
ncbi:hypothetical protein AVEN_272185-1 [Araneus ventricosus]|uniref:Uncharacterized protein n=1 Tax=Araneus ventricosus TaxID=182803 RepID=A0A4Y2HV54_ARAVE|nr:hypothetical protein AVEN_272185-1 [Araneus ventricosus]